MNAPAIHAVTVSHQGRYAVVNLPDGWAEAGMRYQARKNGDKIFLDFIGRKSKGGRSKPVPLQKQFPQHHRRDAPSR